jgi:hypothetical protein
MNSTALQTNSTTQALKILVLKARKGSLLQAEAYLANKGYEVTSVTSAHEAMKIALDMRPDLFIFSVDHSNTKVNQVANMLKSLNAKVIAFSEMPSIQSFNLLISHVADHKVRYPATGIALEKGVERMARQINPSLNNVQIIKGVKSNIPSNFKSSIEKSFDKALQAKKDKKNAISSAKTLSPNEAYDYDYDFETNLTSETSEGQIATFVSTANYCGVLITQYSYEGLQQNDCKNQIDMACNFIRKELLQYGEYIYSIFSVPVSLDKNELQQILDKRALFQKNLAGVDGEEFAIAFLPLPKGLFKVNVDSLKKMIKIPLSEVQNTVDLGCSVYVRLSKNEKDILYSRGGQSLEAQRLEKLKARGLDCMWLKTVDAGPYVLNQIKEHFYL